MSTLADNGVHKKYIKSIIELSRDIDESEGRFASAMTEHVIELFKNPSDWELVYEEHNEDGVDASDVYWEHHQKLSTGPDEVFDEYFDNTVVYLPETQGLIVCKSYKKNQHKTMWHLGLYQRKTIK